MAAEVYSEHAERRPGFEWVRWEGEKAMGFFGWKVDKLLRQLKRDLQKQLHVSVYDNAEPFPLCGLMRKC